MSTASQTHTSITLEPPSGSAEFALKPVSNDARVTRTRQQLNLPTDQPIILAGHQAQLCHPGILAKRFTIQAIAKNQAAHAAWLVVDQDDNDPGALSFPQRTPSAWHRINLSLDPTKHKAGTPTADRAAFSPELPPEHATPALAHAAEALRKRSNERSSAVQLSHTINDLLADPLPFTLASDLARTDLFASVIEDARRDPDRCREALNAAIVAHPDAAMRPLPPGRLPFWKRTELGPRAAATPDDLDNATDTLLPRGILMTLLGRIAACELFIHGTGGRAYEPVADQWLRDWNPPSLQGLTPAPFAIASADLTLPLTNEPLPTRQDIAFARYQAHHASHHPEMLGDESSQQRRINILAQIDRAPRTSKQRAELYRELHDTIAQSRNTHAKQLEAYHTTAAQLQAAYDARAILTARDWPFVLYEHDQLEQLRDTINTRLGL